MCGIAGILSFNRLEVDQKALALMVSALQHRGPDGNGTWINTDGKVAFGHTRLSILDLSEAGKQPMSFKKDKYWLTFNGEIYNFLEIREELEKLGYNFYSNSDTEVVLAAYDAWGPAMQDKMNGMWAFAIYDSDKKETFLSRDRFGVKPLYYYKDSERLLFASEVQAIHKVLGANHPLNDSVIREIISGGFSNHGTDQTYLKDVFNLPGGYSLTINANNVFLEKWYHLNKVKVPDGFKEQARKLKDLINDACRLRMRSDVPVATCLSGGLDSGSITALIADYKGDARFDHYTHQGFCAAFPGTPIDESESAKRLGRQLNSKVHVLEVGIPTAKELTSAMGKCDGPMHALAFYPIYELYKFIRSNNIIVTLDGQGPDEMLGGYRPLKEALNAAIELKKPLWFWDLYKTYRDMGESSQFSSRRFAYDTLKDVIKDFLKFKKVEKTEYQGSPLKPVKEENEQDNSLDRSLFRQFFQSPLPGILQQYDRCSMASGVECRMPFMDYRIVEFVFSLPTDSKVGGGYTKRVLREAMNGILPDETRLNKLKIGFNAPIVDWFRGGLKDFMLEIMNSEEFLNSKYFNGPVLRKNFYEFIKKPNPEWNEAWAFWPPVHFSWWMKHYNIAR